MPKKAGILLTTVGAVLIISALLLFFYNRYEDYSAGREAEILLEDLVSAIEATDSTANPTETEGMTEEETLPADLPEVEIDGYAYVGYVSIPALELELPVMSEWDYSRLKIAPCRQFGSSRTDDLVIAAHNYTKHFGKLTIVEVGTDVFFTDMDGIENHYTVQRVSTLAPEDVDAVLNSGYDLVLYTCTLGGATRVVAFCERTEKGIEGEQHE